MTSPRTTELRRLALPALVAAILRFSVAAQQPSIPDVSSLLRPNGAATVESALRTATGRVEVWVSLADAPVSTASGRNARRGGGTMTAAQQRDYRRALEGKQEALLAAIRGLGGRELARVKNAHNALAVSIDASAVSAMAALPGIVTVRRIRDYRLDLAQTVPYIGAATVQSLGFDGAGVKVAVVDTGVDYTHRNFGGPGTVAGYLAAYGAGTSDPKNTTRDGWFPTPKVVDGFDFVGEVWPDGPLAPDPDPIDHDGHGTHVADIIAGRSQDGSHKGVAPGATLLAVKACSAVSTSCSGIALLRAMDFALDPNDDGDLSDAADVINLSLGDDYGQQEDDLTQACQQAVDFGVIVVASAGNAGDRPYIVSSPSAAPNVISVAQTQIPAAKNIPLMITAPFQKKDSNTAALDFAPVTSDVTGTVVFVGRGCPAEGTTPADPYLTNPAGKIALIDRGSCNVSLKIDRAATAGAIGVLIGLVASGDAVSFGFGGGTHFVPTLVITLATARQIKGAAPPVVATMAYSAAIDLAGSMVNSSSRGPSYSDNAIKPDIGAPGGSTSAEVGTGDGETAFSGTSGAAPMVAGSAALLVQAYPRRAPFEIKAILMNTASTNVLLNPALSPGVLAPITRIGGGEVRVDRALASKTAAWDSKTEIGSLSFGYVAAPDPTTLHRQVTIRNYGNSARTYTLTPTFQYASDEATGAVAVSVPASVSVPPRGHTNIEVTLAIDANKLPLWNLNGGSNGGNGTILRTLEYDGYLTIADGTESVHLPWQVLPHRAAAVGLHPNDDKVKLRKNGVSTLELRNRGAVDGIVNVFSLTGKSRKLPRRDLPRPGDNFAVIDLAAVGVRQALSGTAPVVQFAITTVGERTHPNYPAEFDIYLDVNRDGEFDYVIFNSELGGFAETGQNVVTVFNLATNTGKTLFFASADINSANMVFTALLSDLGLTPNSTFDFSVYAFDNYFTGNLTDAIEGMTYTLGTPRFTSSVDPPLVPIGGTSALTIQEVPGGAVLSPSQTGLLLLYSNAVPRQEADTIEVR